MRFVICDQVMVLLDLHVIVLVNQLLKNRAENSVSIMVMEQGNILFFLLWIDREVCNEEINCKISKMQQIRLWIHSLERHLVDEIGFMEVKCD